MDHPYRSAPDRAFWKRAVADAFAVDALLAGKTLLRRADRVASAGSCFASNIVPFVEKAGYHYVRTERRPALLGALAEESFGYSKFSAAYGNIYTARQALQLLLRALGRFKPQEDRWKLEGGRIVDPFRPGLRFAATCDAEFDLLTRFHLERVLAAFREASVFIFTLGLTEAWRSTDGAVFPACPGTVAGTFDPNAHSFHNFTVQEISEDLFGFIALAREINPSLRFIITVSPVPLVATATEEHVLTATIYSKSVLRVAAAEVVRRQPDCIYFPAYEIVTGPQAPHDFFAADRREPTQTAIATVMSAFLAHCEGAKNVAELPDANAAARKSAASEKGRAELSAQIAAAACEEEASGS